MPTFASSQDNCFSYRPLRINKFLCGGSDAQGSDPPQRGPGGHWRGRSMTVTFIPCKRMEAKQKMTKTNIVFDSNNRYSGAKWPHAQSKLHSNSNHRCVLGLAVNHDYPDEGALLSRKCQCHTWKDCPGGWSQLSFKNINFCTRSRQYQLEAFGPSGPDLVFTWVKVLIGPY